MQIRREAANEQPLDREARKGCASGPDQRTKRVWVPYKIDPLSKENFPVEQISIWIDNEDELKASENSSKKVSVNRTAHVCMSPRFV